VNTRNGGGKGSEKLRKLGFLACHGENRENLSSYMSSRRMDDLAKRKGRRDIYI